MPKLTHKREFGFTLIELMLVVMIVGTMAGATVSLINYTQHRKNANDAIMRVNIEKLVTGLEAYRSVEGKYPTDPNGDGNPNDDPYLLNYLRNGWLNNEPAGSVYTYYVNATRDEIGIITTANSGKKLKYTTSWGQIKECNATAVVGDLGCTGGPPPVSPS